MASSLSNVSSSFLRTGCHTWNPCGSLSDQIGEIIEVLVAEGAEPKSLYEAVHTLDLPAVDVEGGP